MRVAILGSSHMFALAAGRWAESPHVWSFKNLGDFCPGSRIVLKSETPLLPERLMPDVLEWLRQEAGTELLFLTISGSDWLNFCVSNRPEPFDFILRGRPDLPELEGARLIPYPEVRRALATHINHILSGVRLIAQAAPCQVVYLEPPPPIEDNAHIASTATWEQDAIAQRGVTSPWLRLKMYLLQSNLIAEACEAAGVIFHHVPSTGRTADGFMTSEGVSADPMHASPTWGARVMADLDRSYP